MDREFLHLHRSMNRMMHDFESRMFGGYGPTVPSLFAPTAAALLAAPLMEDVWDDSGVPLLQHGSTNTQGQQQQQQQQQVTAGGASSSSAVQACPAGQCTTNGQSCTPATTSTQNNNNQSLSTRPFFGTSALTSFPSFPSIMSTRVNIEDAGASLVLTADLPGFSKNDIKITEHDGVLTFSAERKSEQVAENKEKQWVRRERHFGSVQRSIPLPKGVDATTIKAVYEDGVLKIELPKKQEYLQGPKQIAIQ